MTQPKLITKPFADDALPGYVNEIPKENPVGAPDQNASWSVGFPPITMTDIDDGGLPPNGEDMNGVLRAITKHNLFIGGGGVYEFTDDYITEVGGYRRGAVLISDDKTALWMSIQDNNTQNFNGATKTQWRRIAFTELDSTLASIQNALNTKADKSVTITAGDGLTGGGTLAGNLAIAVDSSVVRTSRTITAGTGLSGGGNLSANRTLSVNYGTTAGTAAQGNDSRLSDSREWTAATISQAEVEAGTATTRRAFTAQRLRQGIVAWFNGISGAIGRTILGRETAAQVMSDLGLGTAATMDVGTGVGQINIIGDVGVYCVDIDDTTQRGRWYVTITTVGAKPTNYGIVNTFGVKNDSINQEFVSLVGGGSTAVMPRFYRNKYGNNAWSPWVEICTTGNTLSTTGQSTQYPMTQKAVTDALNTKVGLSGDQTVGGIKTFSSFPVTPSAAPTADYQAANKKYVDDSAIGVGQTWVDVTAQRSLGTNYVNSTGKAIMVVQVSDYSSNTDPVEVFVDNVKIMSVDQGNGLYWFCPVSFIVPNGSSYRIEKQVNPNIASWVELR